jgi:signal transduction histidine kinase/ActR/RegA family two-component response regulator
MNNQLNSQKSRQGKSNTYEILVSVSLLTVFILVVITGLLSHQRLNYIIETVKSGIRPDRKLILVKEINNNLTEAENSVKSFSLTRSGDYLVRFYELTENTGQKFEELDELVLSKDPLVPYFDTLNQLVGEKFIILDRLLSIQDEFRVQQAMQQVVKSIEEQELSDTSGRTIQVSHQVSDDASKSEVPVKKENIFSRVFKRKNKPVKDSVDTSLPAEAIDTVQVAKEPSGGVSYEKISEKVGQVQEEVLSRDRQLRQEEWDLLQEDKEVMKKIRQLISFLEDKEETYRQEMTREAELKAGEIKMIIMAFGITASCFIFLAALVVYWYVKKNNEYKAVLEQARKDAEELAKAKEMFLANMSHEIRTPMNIISGFLSQVLTGPLDDSQREQLMIIKKSSDHLLQLLNDLLDLSKLQADKLELLETTFSPAGIIGEIHLLFEPAARAKNLQFTASADPGLPSRVYGDPVRLRQILFNLLGNAIKFTEYGTVSLRSFTLDKDENKTVLAFEVSDTGIGLNESDIGKIFGDFEKAAAKPGSNTEGAGLGLSITRKLVSLQGGSIRVESRQGTGSSFHVEIPYKISPGNFIPEVKDAPVNTGHLKDMHILVVDDDEYNRRLARIILEKYECRVSESGSAEDALEKIRTPGIDLVLMDIHLPGMKGPEAAVRIKQIIGRTGKNIPVIAVTATISKGDLEKFRQTGLDDFVLKPYKEETLLTVISRLTGNLNAPGYDLEPLKTSSGGNDSFVKEMISLFIKDTDEGLTRLAPFLELKEWQPASELAHKMISPCRHLKANKLAALLKDIENTVDNAELQNSAMDNSRQARIEFERIREDMILKNEC